MVEEALRDPISVKMLEVTGDRIMEITGEKPSKKIGDTLHALLEEVLDDPARNTAEYLEDKAQILMKMNEKELSELGNKAKLKLVEEESAIIAELHKKHKV
jgi:hypothetical protein